MSSLFTLNQPQLPIAGTQGQTFPVRRIYCIGRNYPEHAREMGHDPEREPPFYFMKPADCIVNSGSQIPYPPMTNNLHYEIEMVAAIGKAGSQIKVEQALDHVYGYAVGIDLTRRDLQAAAKSKGHPWEVGKVFDHAAPISALHTVRDIGHPTTARIWLTLNEVLKQDGHINQMTWSLPEIIAHLSQLNTLMPGDVIFTGTPAGVGPVQLGDTLHGGIEGIDEVILHITQ